MAKKKSKAKARKRSATKDLAPKNAKDVKGGITVRKAGKGQQEYMNVKLTDVIVSS